MEPVRTVVDSSSRELLLGRVEVLKLVSVLFSSGDEISLLRFSCFISFSVFSFLHFGLLLPTFEVMVE